MSNVSVVIAILIGVFGIVGGISAAVAFLIKYALLPWLEKHIAIPVQETRHQVKVNRHESREPTVLDKIEDVGETAKTAVHIARENARHSKQAAGLAQEALDGIKRLATMYDGHLEWSQEQVDLIWQKLRERANDNES